MLPSFSVKGLIIIQIILGLIHQFRTALPTWITGKSETLWEKVSACLTLQQTFFK